MAGRSLQRSARDDDADAAMARAAVLERELDLRPLGGHVVRLEHHRVVSGVVIPDGVPGAGRRSQERYLACYPAGLKRAEGEPGWPESATSA